MDLKVFTKNKERLYFTYSKTHSIIPASNVKIEVVSDLITVTSVEANITLPINIIKDMQNKLNAFLEIILPNKEGVFLEVILLLKGKYRISEELEYEMKQKENVIPTDFFGDLLKDALSFILLDLRNYELISWSFIEVSSKRELKYDGLELEWIAPDLSKYRP